MTTITLDLSGWTLSLLIFVVFILWLRMRDTKRRLDAIEERVYGKPNWNRGWL